MSTSLWSLGRNLTMPFFALYVLELGGSYVDVGKIFAVGAVIKVVPTLLGGYLADRIGRKRIVYSMSYLLACARAPTAKTLRAPSKLITKSISPSRPKKVGQ